MILKLLNTEEIGFNYIIASVGALVALVDFGFAPQFIRNIAYVFSGAKSLKKEGVADFVESNDISYHLLAALITTAKKVYAILGMIALLLLLSVGTIYVYHVTQGFTNVDHSLIIWIVFSMSMFFQIYYDYYNFCLIGAGKIKQAQIAQISTQLFKIILTIILLLLGLGLLGVVLAYLISPFLNRFLAYRFFFVTAMKKELKKWRIEKEEIKQTFSIIWHNAKNAGICKLAQYLTYNTTLLLVGVFCSLEEVASYGLTIQLYGVICAGAITLMDAYQPLLASLIVSNKQKTLRNKAALGMFAFYGVYVFGAAILILLGNPILNLMGANANLPSSTILLTYAIFYFLYNNMWQMCQVLIAANQYPFTKSLLYTSVWMVVLGILSLKYTEFGLMGVVLVTGMVQLYTDYYWVKKVLIFLKIDMFSFIILGLRQGVNICLNGVENMGLRMKYGK